MDFHISLSGRQSYAKQVTYLNSGKTSKNSRQQDMKLSVELNRFLISISINKLIIGCYFQISTDKTCFAYYTAVIGAHV